MADLIIFHRHFLTNFPFFLWNFSRINKNKHFPPNFQTNFKPKKALKSRRKNKLLMKMWKFSKWPTCVTPSSLFSFEGNFMIFVLFEIEKEILLPFFKFAPFFPGNPCFRESFRRKCSRAGHKISLPIRFSLKLLFERTFPLVFFE